MMVTVQSNIYQLEKETEWLDLGNGVKRQVFGFDKNLMLVKVKFETGAIGLVHQHPHSQASYVESGVFEVTIGAEKSVLKAGDGYNIPSNTPHGCICIEAGMLVDSFSPAREDFL